jgi:anti-sigma regulatory factor (Ser/Thr protein kinase)
MDEQAGPALRLPDSPRSPRLAREYAERFLHESGHDTLAVRTALVVSELVTNAMSHGGGGCVLRLRVVPGDPPCVRVEVDDSRPDGEVAPNETGTGLRLVAENASNWGVDRHDDGKTVWVELH